MLPNFARFASALASAMALLLASACADQVGPRDCSLAEETLGLRACVHRVDSVETWRAIAAEVSPVDQVRTTRYLVPAIQEARLHTLIEDSSAGFQAHFQFLTTAFADRFPALTLQEYEELVSDPARREFYAGSLTEYIRPDGSTVYGYIVWAEQSAAGTIECSDVGQVHEELGRALNLQPLVAVPTDSFQREVLATCDVPTYDPATAIEYEVYTKAVGYGTVRRYTLAGLAAATQRAEFGFQDLLVVEEAPIDIESVTSGVVTGSRQGELSHLNVRSASRGTPNCYLRGAYRVLAQWEGQLVRMECRQSQLDVRAASLEEAEAFWDQLRPDPVVVPAPDLSWDVMAPLLEVPTGTGEERGLSTRRYGSKGTNLATLYQRIPGERQLEGFLVPFAFYDRFMNLNGFQDRVSALLIDPSFQSDAALRRTRLEELRTDMRGASCDPELIAVLGQAVEDSHGDRTTMVRFRSSSNAEDALGFNGAGLYESTSVCAADDVDNDSLGPSLCDANKLTERGICRGLTKVWSSLWSPKAFEERSWYSIDHSRVSMAILVNTRTAQEQANIVAFSGNPLGPVVEDYLVNAQIGELDVVSSQPGVWPEKSLLSVDAEEGAVLEILRARNSTEVPVGEHVLDDSRLRELGTALWDISQIFPIDASVPEGQILMLDTEWKIRSDGQLIVKQLRPFGG